MPFQSEKQRRYLHANHPEIANRWEAKYGLGGVAGLNAQLNSLPEYYLPKNQGGRIGFDNGTEIPESPEMEDFLEDLKRKNYYKLLEEYHRWKENYDRKIYQAQTQEAAHGGLIPSHEAGIYGLAEGGVPDIGFSKVKPSNDGSRPGYFTAEYGGEGAGRGADTPSSSGGEGGYQTVHDTGAVTQTPGKTTTDQGHTGEGWQTYAIPDTKKTTTTDDKDYGPYTKGWDKKIPKVSHVGDKTAKKKWEEVQNLLKIYGGGIWTLFNWLA